MRETDVLIWDEASMSSRRMLEVIKPFIIALVRKVISTNHSVVNK